jgi:hypothetical protein
MEEWPDRINEVWINFKLHKNMNEWINDFIPETARNKPLQ